MSPWRTILRVFPHFIYVPSSAVHSTYLTAYSAIIQVVFSFWLITYKCNRRLWPYLFFQFSKNKIQAPIRPAMLGHDDKMSTKGFHSLLRVIYDTCADSKHNNQSRTQVSALISPSWRVWFLKYMIASSLWAGKQWNYPQSQNKSVLWVKLVTT